jgi:ATP-dependent Clp protease adaptor protein ClpS
LIFRYYDPKQDNFPANFVAKRLEWRKKFLTLWQIMQMPAHKEQFREEEQQDVDVLEELDKGHSLIVWNDDVNTFEWVIETLIEVCGHTAEQAEQCAMIIHTQGKYAVKNGSYDELKPMKDAIVERGIDATIEETVNQ